MNISLQQFIVWLVVGALAGTLTGRLVTWSKKGLGRWTNLGVGMVGALIGGLIFKTLNILPGLRALTISFEDLVSAIAGSLLFVFVWWLVGKFRR